MNFSSGNTITLFVDGDEAFEAAYAAIESAQKRVWLETYILEPDEVGQQAIGALAEAARRGCDVVLLFDRWGSWRIKKHHIDPILLAGGRAIMYNPIGLNRRYNPRRASVLHRDHRKILIADEIGFSGGRNVSIDYGGPGPELFYDLMVKVEGPAVYDLANVLVESHFNATGRILTRLPKPDPLPLGVDVSVLALNAHADIDSFDQALNVLLDEAQQTCSLMTPYFIPPEWFYQALKSAAERGVVVRLITAGKSDVPAARVAGRHLYGSLMEAGVHIYEMLHPTLHAKALVVDGQYGVVGSYNVDTYGARRNLEVGVLVRNQPFAGHLQEVFDAAVLQCQKVEPNRWAARSWWQRFQEWLLFRIAQL